MFERAGRSYSQPHQWPPQSLLSASNPPHNDRQSLGSATRSGSLVVLLALVGTPYQQGSGVGLLGSGSGPNRFQAVGGACFSLNSDSRFGPAAPLAGSSSPA